MTNYTTPYKDLESSPFTAEDVEYIHHLFYDECKSKAEIERITGLTYHLVGRVISSIEAGVFGNDSVIGLDDGYGSIIINDGVTVEIHNHYDSHTQVTNKKKKISTGKLNAWSKKVRERDMFTCSVCGKTGKHMEAHHIKPKSLYPDDALDELNGVCICQKCHQKYNNRYSPSNQNSVTFSRFIFEENRSF